MVDELPQVGVAGADSGVFFGIGLGFGSLFRFRLGDYFRCQRSQVFLIKARWRQGAEHASEASFKLLGRPHALQATDIAVHVAGIGFHGYTS